MGRDRTVRIERLTDASEPRSRPMFQKPANLWACLSLMEQHLPTPLPHENRIWLPDIPWRGGPLP